MKIGQNIRFLRKKAGLSQEELGSILGVNDGAISKYEKGRVENIPIDKIKKMAEVFGVTPSFLMFGEEENVHSAESLGQYGILPIDKKSFPVLGKIACGEPIYAEQDHESYIEASSKIDADFCLIAQGDSMTGARIFNGDVVFIKKQPIVNNGEIAAVIIDNEATLKRWYYYPEKEMLTLNAENSAYPPLTYKGAELEQIRCLGKAVCFISKL